MNDRLDRIIPWAMVVTVLAVAVFAFVQSYTHVFTLGLGHHQTGASLRMLPLSVDWLMFAAGLVRLHLMRKGLKHWLPLAGLALGAIATLVANIASGIIWGWETAAIQAWAPVVLFVVVELAMLLVRTARAKPEPSILPYAGPPLTTEEVAVFERKLTELSHPAPAPDPEPETASFPAVTDGWGQLGAQPGASQGLTGIGLANGKG